MRAARRSVESGLMRAYTALDVRGSLGQHTWYAAVEKAVAVVAEPRRHLYRSLPYVGQCSLSSGSKVRVMRMLTMKARISMTFGRRSGPGSIQAENHSHNQPQPLTPWARKPVFSRMSMRPQRCVITNRSALVTEPALEACSICNAWA